MRRNMDLIRQIAFAVEKATPPVISSELVIDGFTQEQIVYHCELMLDSQLIVAIDMSDLLPMVSTLSISRLTSKGHDFVDAARSDTIWNKAKKTIESTVKTASIETMTACLKAVASAAIGLPIDP
ncbi:MAG: DUF2513 domain-containing protein [Planctomycetota bacterium]